MSDPKYKILKRNEEKKYAAFKYIRFRDYVDAADFEKKPAAFSAVLKNDIDLPDTPQKTVSEKKTGKCSGENWSPPRLDHMIRPWW